MHILCMKDCNLDKEGEKVGVLCLDFYGQHQDAFLLCKCYLPCSSCIREEKELHQKPLEYPPKSWTSALCVDIRFSDWPQTPKLFRCFWTGKYDHAGLLLLNCRAIWPAPFKSQVLSLLSELQFNRLDQTHAAFKQVTWEVFSLQLFNLGRSWLVEGCSGNLPAYKNELEPAI